MMLWRVYRRLWREAEKDRRAADASLRRMAETVAEAHREGYLAGLRMAAAAIPGELDQPALRAVHDVIGRVTRG